MECPDILKIPEPYPSQCYCWGSGSGGTLGVNNNGSIRKISLHPCIITLPTSDPVVSIASSDRRNIVITCSGDCYSWGKPPLGRKMASLLAEAKPKKVHVQENCDIEKVILGETHGVILAKNGSILSFGDATGGKLGLRNKTKGIVQLPTKVSMKDKCVDVACGFASTTVLIHGGDEYLTFGNGGLKEHFRQTSKVPKPVRVSVKFVNISGGTSHTAAVSSDGQCFTWGLSQNGRLGHGDVDSQSDGVVIHPRLVQYFLNNKISTEKSFCGGAHTCILDKGGNIFSFGWNQYFQCGTMRNDDIFVPTKVSIQSSLIVEMSCGFAHTVAIDVSGSLYV